MMLRFSRSAWPWKIIAAASLLFGVLLLTAMITRLKLVSQVYFHVSGDARALCKPIKTEFVNNSGAISLLQWYKDKYISTTHEVTALPDPNNRSTITTWWQALAMIDWYMGAPVRYTCKTPVTVGNWMICQDEPYTIKPPCLVYSFGINWQFQFDDAMAKMGCEVHMFDPSMKAKDHMRGNATFHNMGIGSYNSDTFVPRRDVYVRSNQMWKIRTVKAIMKELGHENRVIDVFKMDVETTEWTVIDNMLETEVFRFIRQFDVEYHIFKDYPIPHEYLHLYQVFTRLREIGFREYFRDQHHRETRQGKFTYQADVTYVNAFFDKNI